LHIRLPIVSKIELVKWELREQSLKARFVGLMARFVAASPPDVRYRLKNQEPFLKLTSSPPASPPDVRRGYASPLNLLKVWGWAPGSAYGP
jgi:hypothetical protein